MNMDVPLPNYIEVELRRIGVIDSFEIELPAGGNEHDEIKKILSEFDENGEPNW